MREFSVVLAVMLLGGSVASAISGKLFPPDFVFGVSTSAYQIEGAWNESGKSESILDYICHVYPNSIADRKCGDMACDSYHKVDEDIAMLKELGVNFYRFSISWSRLLPNGSVSDGINSDAVNYYMEILEKLEAAGIDAMITLVHFDPPVELMKQQLFLDSRLNHLFVDYARLAFELFGSKVKYWVTFNEAAGFCENAMNAFYSNPGSDVYMAAHNVIKCHAEVYHMYNNEFRRKYGGQVSIVLNTDWYEPASNSPADIEAVERTLMFKFGWIAHPLFYGDYPNIMKERIFAQSHTSSTSRLPKFSFAEQEFIKGTMDFIPLNTYTTHLVTDAPNYDVVRTYEKDLGILMTADPSWESTVIDWLYVVPAGMRKVLQWVSKNYSNKPILITENGYAESGILDDERRINYLQTYLTGVLDAIYYDHINVIGYSAWSLMDNWELSDGYTAKFGLYFVNFSSPNRERIPKNSVPFYKKVLETRCVSDYCN